MQTAPLIAPLRAISPLPGSESPRTEGRGSTANFAAMVLNLSAAPGRSPGAPATREQPDTTDDGAPDLEALLDLLVPGGADAVATVPGAAIPLAGEVPGGVGTANVPDANLPGADAPATAPQAIDAPADAPGIAQAPSAAQADAGSDGRDSVLFATGTNMIAAGASLAGRTGAQLPAPSPAQSLAPSPTVPDHQMPPPPPGPGQPGPAQPVALAQIAPQIASGAAGHPANGDQSTGGIGVSGPTMAGQTAIPAGIRGAPLPRDGNPHGSPHGSPPGPTAAPASSPGPTLAPSLAPALAPTIATSAEPRVQGRIEYDDLPPPQPAPAPASPPGSAVSSTALAWTKAAGTTPPSAALADAGGADPAGTLWPAWSELPGDGGREPGLTAGASLAAPGAARIGPGSLQMVFAAQPVIDQLAARITQAPQGRIELALDPVELGRVDMAFQARDGTLQVLMAVERPETLDLIRRNLALLEADLRAMGMDQIDLRLDLSGTPNRERAQRTLVSDTPAPIRSADPLPDAIQRAPLTATGRLDLRL